MHVTSSTYTTPLLMYFKLRPGVPGASDQRRSFDGPIVHTVLRYRTVSRCGGLGWE
jgi:hypothetical protein